MDPEKTGGVRRDRGRCSPSSTTATNEITALPDSLDCSAKVGAQWQVTVRSCVEAAVAHELAHHCRGRPRTQQPFGHNALRVGPWRLRGHVAGADEIVAHRYAHRHSSLRPSPLLLTAALAARLEADQWVIAILALMAVGVVLMLTRMLPTAFTLALLALGIAILAGAPLFGDENSILTTVLQTGSATLAATMIAVLLGSWLGTLMDDTGIAATLVRKIVEFGGERPAVVALGVFAVAILCGSITGSAPAAMLAGVVGIPAMIAVGCAPVVAGGTVLMGIAAGSRWSCRLAVPVRRGGRAGRARSARSSMMVFPFALVVGVAYVLIETRRTGARHAWAVRAPRRCGRRRGNVAVTRPGTRCSPRCCRSCSRSDLTCRSCRRCWSAWSTGW